MIVHQENVMFCAYIPTIFPHSILLLFIFQAQLRFFFFALLCPFQLIVAAILHINFPVVQF